MFIKTEFELKQFYNFTVLVIANIHNINIDRSLTVQGRCESAQAKLVVVTLCSAATTQPSQVVYM